MVGVVTRAGLLHGMRLALPLTPGIAVFAAAFGAAAVQKGLSTAEAVLMSGLVYAGSSQLMALEVWPAGAWTATVMLTIAAVTFTVNARMILQGASLQPWLAPLPGPTLWTSLGTLTDANWAITERYRAEGGEDRGVFIGAGIALWLIWTLATIPGAVAGRLIEDPKAVGIDLVMPVFFMAMTVRLWRGREDVVIWTIAGTVSLATWWLVGGYAFIVTGALAGAAAGAFLPERGDE